MAERELLDKNSNQKPQVRHRD